MKLILTQEVANLGGPGEVVEVKDGYGRNYLIPRGYAMRWTRGAERQVDELRRSRAVREARDLGQASELKGQLEGLRVKLAARAGNGRRLFGSVTPADIVAAVKNAGGPDLDRRRVEVRNPIRTLGTHHVEVRLHPHVAANLTMDITSA